MLPPAPVTSTLLSFKKFEMASGLRSFGFLASKSSIEISLIGSFSISENSFISLMPYPVSSSTKA